jgi:hypothetical protein
MVAILQLYDNVFGPPFNHDLYLSKQYVISATCHHWGGGTLTGDGTTMPLFERSGLYGDCWFDRKLRYSVNAQVCKPMFSKTNAHSFLKLINLVHNLYFIDYAIGHMGNVHNSYAFRNTRMYKEPNNFLRPNEWMWADSAYPPTT